MGQLVGVIDGKIDGEAEGDTDATTVGQLDPGRDDTKRLGWSEPVTEGFCDGLVSTEATKVGYLEDPRVGNKEGVVLRLRDGMIVGGLAG